MNVNSLDIKNNMLSQHSQKLFSLCKFFNQHFSVRNSSGTSSFLGAQEFEAILKQMPEYFRISP